LFYNSGLPNVRVIDFGNAAYESSKVYRYIQSRYYRAPEILLGLPYVIFLFYYIIFFFFRYNTQVDMWSLGCITVELFIGQPIFPGSSDHDHIRRITQMLGLVLFLFIYLLFYYFILFILFFDFVQPFSIGISL
jgi:dual specificity protein kinase YAK1